MRFLSVLIFAAIFSSTAFAQNTDTTKVVSDTSSLNSKVIVPVSIQLADTVSNKSATPTAVVDSLTKDSAKNTLAADSIKVIVPVKDVATKSDTTAAITAPAATSASKVYTPAAVVPTEPLNPNYIYSTLVPTMALVKKDVKAKTDTIVMLNGDKLLANVKKFTVKDLFYGFPGEQKMEQVDRRYVQKIIYKYGRVEIISAVQVDVREVGGWRDVKVLKKRNASLDKMIELGEVEGIDEGTREKYVDARDLERSATITLQKKAALLGATVVLITTRDVRRPYGDPPYVKLVGMAYKPK